MKQLFYAMLLLCIVSHIQAQGIQFTEQLSWTQLKEKARAEGKFIFVDCYATWCAPCKQMDLEVYPDQTVGEEVNKHFLSVKVQMDKTEKDNAWVQSWYTDAIQIQQAHKVAEFPSYLFFDPEGRLTHKGVGFQDKEAFVQLCKTALDPQKSFGGMLQQYEKGQLQGEALLSLALTAKSFKYDSLALVIAQTYRKKVLDKQPLQNVITPALLPMFGEFAEVYTIKDKLVRYLYKHSEDTDEKFQQKGVSQRITDFMITRDIITPMLYVDNKPKDNEPDWKKLENMLTRKFDAKTAKRNILNNKCGYYHAKKDWQKFIYAWIDKIDTVGIDMKDIWGGVEVNNTVYNIIFKYSNDPYVLNKAIGYMETLLETDPNSSSRLDTYACILYKNGQKKKALEVEKRALTIAEEQKLASSISLYKIRIAKMEKGEPIEE